MCNQTVIKQLNNEVYDKEPDSDVILCSHSACNSCTDFEDTSVIKDSTATSGGTNTDDEHVPSLTVNTARDTHECLNRNNNSIMDWISKRKPAAADDVNVMTEGNNNKSLKVESLCKLSLSSLKVFLNTLKSRKLDCNKSVINLSSFQLNQDHISLLGKGLSFCPTPGEPDLGELR